MLLMTEAFLCRDTRMTYKENLDISFLSYHHLFTQWTAWKFMVYYMGIFRKAHLYFFMLKEREHFVDFLGDSTGLAHWDACGR